MNWLLGIGVAIGIFLLLPIFCTARVSGATATTPKSFFFDITVFLGVLALSLEFKEGVFYRLRLLGLPILSGHRPAEVDKKSEKPKKTKPKRSLIEKFKRLKATMGFGWRERRRLWRTVIRIINCCRGREWHGHIVFGFDNPATTGEMIGLFYALGGPRQLCTIEPDFSGRRLTGDVECQFYLLPIMLFFVLLWSGLNLAIRFPFKQLRGETC